MHNIKLVGKKGKRNGDSYSNNTNIHSGYRYRIRHRKMCQVYNEKRKKMTTEEKNTFKSRNNHKSRENKTSKYVGISDDDGIKQVEMKEKKLSQRKLHETKLFNRKLIKEINAWVVAF